LSCGGPGQIFSGVVAAGYNDVNPARAGLSGYPALDRLRPSELAGQLEFTRQSVNDLLGHREQRGCLVGEPDPAGGRARVVRLTATGRRPERTVSREAGQPKAGSPGCPDPAGSRKCATRSNRSQVASPERTCLPRDPDSRQAALQVAPRADGQRRRSAWAFGQAGISGQEGGRMVTP
jgi:DNA-binding MarR family transcriptional regulator